MSRRTEHPSSTPRLAVVLTRQSPDQSDGDVAASLAELEKLLQGLGIDTADRLVQKRRSNAAGGFIGAGKQEELAELLEALQKEHGDDAVILAVDGELRPGQLHQLESALNVPVLDRTGVVLRVFDQRAQTPLARLEIEIARLEYEAPRVRENAKALGDREGGGGRGGRGHTNTELERQRIRDRLAMLRRQLADLSTRQEKQRARREGLRVALVGYTNAGKSSLMRALTASDVLVEDKLFATLGSTVRALAPTTSPPILVSDTVGFIRNLPHDLVASFRSTLAEARDAGLLLHVVDAADPAWPEQMQVTRESIAAVGADDVRELVVLNKIDRVSPEARAALASALPGAIQVSAFDADSMKQLHAAIEAAFSADLVGELLVVPYADGRVLGEIRSRARVVAETWDDDATVLAVQALPADLESWRHLVPERREVATVEELLSRARRHGLELTTESADFDRSGLDFLVAHAVDAEGTPWVVRTPRRADVYESSRIEARALALVKPRLAVQVPDWRVHAPDVIAYPRLPGLPAVTVDPLAGPAWNVIDPASPNQAFLDSVARALVALQAIPPETARLAGVPVRSIDESRAGLARTIEATADTLAVPERLRARWQRWLDDDSYWPDHLALSHGDLHPGHMLLAPDGTLLGILDWTEAQLTDPSVDFAMFHGCFGPGPLAELADLFERAGGRTWPRLLDHAAERWAAFPALAAEWALRTGNKEALTFARNEIAAAAEA